MLLRIEGKQIEQIVFQNDQITTIKSFRQYMGVINPIKKSNIIHENLFNSIQYRITQIIHSSIMHKAILLYIFLIPTLTLKATLSNLVEFFNHTYDTNRDGYSTIQEFLQYFAFMEPEHNLTKRDIIGTFNSLDRNQDNRITLKELVESAQIDFNYHIGHKQLHLGFTGYDNQMQIMWVSNPETYEEPVVQYGLYPFQLSQSVYANVTTYNVGHLGFHGKIYKAIMTNLINGKQYYYKVGDLKTNTYSEIKHFSAPPQKDRTLQEINYAVCGDVGTFAPFGHLIISKIAKDNFVRPFDFMWLTGDIAYAGVSSQKIGEIQPIWDLFGELTESFSAYIPFMPGVGNHEAYYNYTAYLSRYSLPKVYEGQTNFWFSFDYGQLHIVYVSSQHDYQKGSEQYQFLQNDLKKSSANPHTKWIMVGAHRSFYYAAKRGNQDTPKLVRELQDLLIEYRVDIVQTGHLHEYERSWPVIKGKAQKQGQTQNHFYSPKGPIYIVQGTGGALQKDSYLSPVPEYSLKKIKDFGYGKVNIKGNTLKYQFISAFNGKVLDQWFITK